MERDKPRMMDPAVVPGPSGAALRPRRARIPLSRLERWLARRFLQAVGNPPLRLQFWDGTQIEAGYGERLTAEVRDRAAFWRLITNPSLCFGEEYSEGGIEIEGNLCDFMEAVLAHRPPYLDSKFFGALGNRPQLNTLSGSRENIHHHYDIGNDFYSLWLDREMQYTCAYYPEADADLETAQRAKLDLVCRKLALRPGETVVEAGCGWGGLARHMARHYGVKVKAFNISHQQVSYARERAQREGLSSLVEYVEDDYRNISGRFDAFVSVGMLEHVGTDNYRQMGEVIERSLAPHGRGLVHSIGQNHAEPLGGWIEKHIFPGAYPPTLREMMELFEPFRLTVQDVENLRPHYARTVEHWLERYELNADRIRAMYDERFYRAWRLYLASSMASFKTGQLQLFQVVFTRTRTNYPWTRQHLYTEAGHER